MTDLDELREDLDEFAQAKKEPGHSPREERIIAGFEEIRRFVERHGRAPQHGEDKDIFERLYAVRLDRLRALDECRSLLGPLDHQGLLRRADEALADPLEAMDKDELLAELKDAASTCDITELRHVRPKAGIRAAEEIANREKCADFERFKPLFEQAENELRSGLRQTRPFGQDASVEEGNFFILAGLFAYVAELGETFKAPHGEYDARLRVIYSNGTESNLLRRSLQRALYKDEAGRRLTEPDPGPLFSASWDADDRESGSIYVLRSLSDHPFVAEHRTLIHKIGVTGGKIEARIANAAHDATYLLADVQVVATYRLAGIKRTRLENLFHRIFAAAQIDITIHDRFGHPVRPREWFLVPLHVIDEAVQHIRDGSIAKVSYDPKTARFLEPAHDLPVSP